MKSTEFSAADNRRETNAMLMKFVLRMCVWMAFVKMVFKISEKPALIILTVSIRPVDVMFIRMVHSFAACQIALRDQTFGHETMCVQDSQLMHFVPSTSSVIAESVLKEFAKKVAKTQEKHATTMMMMIAQIQLVVGSHTQTETLYVVHRILSFLQEGDVTVPNNLLEQVVRTTVFAAVTCVSTVFAKMVPKMQDKAAMMTSTAVTLPADESRTPTENLFVVRQMLSSLQQG